MLNSIVVILRSIATKNPYSCLFHKYRLSGGRAAASRSGGPQTSGCRRACPASCARPTPTALLCHSERSESTNAASAETACGLCRARRRKTNEVQSRIYGIGLQILRRYAPQNDKLLLNCELSPLRGLDFDSRSVKTVHGLYPRLIVKLCILNCSRLRSRLG